MNRATQAIFDEHKNPKHARRSDVQGIVRPLARIVARIVAQNAEHRALLLDARFDDETPDAFRGKFRALEQTLAARERVASEIVARLTELDNIDAQWDRYVQDAETELGALDA